MSQKQSLPDQFLQQLALVTGKRARIVVDHILEHGHITTEELEKTYGYSHPPRAARDVREQGIPLETFKVKSSDGRNIAAYRFGKLAEIRQGQFRGRKVFPKQLKDELYALGQAKCAVCAGQFAKRYLQIDHRIPYQIAGDIDHFDRITQDYMLLCASCNRAKSWSCENCPNWQTQSPQICSHCYWAFPQEYTHIALREVRRADILWAEDEVNVYDKLKAAAQQKQLQIPDYVKQIVEEQIEKGENSKN